MTARDRQKVLVCCNFSILKNCQAKNAIKNALLQWYAIKSSGVAAYFFIEWYF